MSPACAALTTDHRISSPRANPATTKACRSPRCTQAKRTGIAKAREAPLQLSSALPSAVQVQEEESGQRMTCCILYAHPPARSKFSGMPCDASRREAVERSVPRRGATLLLHFASEGTGTTRACRLIGRGSRVARRHLLLEQDSRAEL
jgi:hypothetical protein